MSWLETYRGTVCRWEVDNVDHFTVAFYFARFEDATLHLLHAIGLDPAALAGAGRASITLDSRVRYQRELRVGDVLHIASGVIEVDDGGLVIGHHVFDSADGTLCTTVEQRVAVVRIGARASLPLSPAQQAAARARQIEWSRAPEVVGPPEPATDDGFIESARDSIKPEALWEHDHAQDLRFTDFMHAAVARSAFYAHVLALFERFDVLALPVSQVWPFDVKWHWPKIVAGRAMDTYHRWMEVTIYATFAGLPAISVPAGFDPTDRLPMGLQLVGPPEGDAELLGVAAAYEDMVPELLARRPPS